VRVGEICFGSPCQGKSRHKKMYDMPSSGSGALASFLPDFAGGFFLHLAQDRTDTKHL
jgi:hypothetical protein